MSTRACYVFKDENNTFTVYKHWDGYPEGAASFFVNAIPFAWDLPRFEAMDFAAAFIAGNKTKGGDVYITTKPEDHSDIDYVYELIQAKNGQLIIKAFETEYVNSVNDYDTPESATRYKEIFYGRLKGFVSRYGDDYTKKEWDALDKSDNKLYKVA